MTTTTSKYDKVKTPASQAIRADIGYDTDRYFLQIGHSIVTEGLVVYQIINKQQDIIEGESISLAEALYTLGNRTHSVKEYEEMLENGFPPIEAPPEGGNIH
jgi:hypothetical protein